MTSVKVALSPKVNFGIRLLSNMNKILTKHLKIFQGAQSICFYKEPHSGCHYICIFHFIDKQVMSVKVALSPKVSYGIRLLSNMNRVLVRAFENFPVGTEHLFWLYREIRPAE